MRRGRAKSQRGSLAMVLLLAVTLLLIGLGMSSALVSHLTLTSQSVRRAGTRQFVHAALTEFITRARQMQSESLIDDAPALLHNFADHPVLFDRDGVRITLMLQEPHPSIDNTLGSQPRNSSFDHQGELSVPPYSLALVLAVRSGNQEHLVEACLQQVWPYALASVGPTLLPGKVITQPGMGSGDQAWDDNGQPHLLALASSIKGRVLACKDNLVVPLAVRNTQEGYFLKLDSSFEMLDRVARYSQAFDTIRREGADPARVNLNGLLRLSRVTATERIGTARVSFPSEGATLDGDVDFYENGNALVQASGPSVPLSLPEVNPSSAVASARLHRDTRLGGLDPSSEAARIRWDHVLSMPGVSEWSTLDAAEFTSQPGKTFILTKNQELLGQQPTPAPVNSASPIVADQLNLEKVQAVLPIEAGQLSEVRVIYHPSGHFVVNTSVVLGDDAMPRGTDAGSGTDANGARAQRPSSLFLDGCSLAVQGSLRMHSSSRSWTQTAIRGRDATLIVKNDLVTDDGELSSAGDGMVIYCQRFAIAARGSYQGVIVAREGGIFFPANTLDDPDHSQDDTVPVLHIKGGLVLGGSGARIKGDVQTPTGSGTDDASDDTAPYGANYTVNSFVSTQIEYDPHYMRSLNKFGDFKVLAIHERS